MPNNTFEVLYLDHKYRLEKFCLLYLTNYNIDDAEGVVQQSFTNLLASRKKEVILTLPHDEAQLYLRGIATNVWRKRYREKINPNNTDSIDDGNSTYELKYESSLDDEFDHEEKRKKCFKLLREYYQLDELESKIFWLYHLEGDYNLAEIASICGFSLRWIKKKKANAEKKMIAKNPQLKTLL